MSNADLLERYFDIILEFFQTFPGISLTHNHGIYDRTDIKAQEGILEAKLDKKDFPLFHSEANTTNIIIELCKAFQKKGVEPIRDKIGLGLAIQDDRGNFLITVTVIATLAVCSITQNTIN